MAQEYDGIWPGPKGPTVWEQELRSGLRRLVEAGQDVPRGPGPAGGPKKAFATLQDIVAGAAQALGSPVAGLLSPFAPAANAALDLPIPNPADALQGRASNTRLRDLVNTAIGASNAVGDFGADLTGYDKERARELSGAGLMALAGPAAKAVPKVGAGLESLLNRVGMTTRPAPGQYNTFISLNQKSNLPQEIIDEQGYAKYLEDQGYTPMHIFERTGWLRNPLDGDWRYEISDADAKLQIPTQAFEEFRKLQQKDWSLDIDQPAEKVLHHPKLFEYLPQLRNVPIDASMTQGGSFQPISIVKLSDRLRPMSSRDAHGKVTLGTRSFDDYNNVADDEQTLDILLHELAGHGVQRLNPFASHGTNLEAVGGDYKKYSSTGGEVEANLIPGRKYLKQSQLREYYPFVETPEQLLYSFGPTKLRSPFLNKELHSMGRADPTQVDLWNEYYKSKGLLK